ncbi:hypothetical protein NM688_g3275 [Phlebia brevispora]|uniref:Uncharacterized protein n=1 Tax=Phlebia brevispora TaxID=194682 RepID=A0ACC1T610_9APHY|nr:hypothetical protein NM688_g3275 [Phlebia brevispora]
MSSTCIRDALTGINNLFIDIMDYNIPTLRDNLSDAAIHREVMTVERNLKGKALGYLDAAKPPTASERERGCTRPWRSTMIGAGLWQGPGRRTLSNDSKRLLFSFFYDFSLSARRLDIARFMSTQETGGSTLPHRVATASLSRDDIAELRHPLNPECRRSVFALGDACGLTKQGIHFCRVDPHVATTVYHWHNNDEEWCYILEAGEGGAILLTHEEGTETPKEVKVYKGDFLAFPSGKRNAHALRAGDHELVYLVGGTREALDVCTYPLEGKKLVADWTSSDTQGKKLEMWYVDEGQIQKLTK